MPIQIKAPDGSIAQFPDGTPDSTITSVMAKAYPQPSFFDRAIASPIGRLAHDAVISPIMGVGSMLSKIDPLRPGGDNAAAVEQPYQAALARNRNTPGYAEARAKADALVAAKGGSGLSDQIISSLTPAMSGVAGLFGGGFDTSNAAADAQTASQNDYQQRHPVLSTGAQLAGGFLAAPDAKLGKLPVAIPKQPVPSIANLKAQAKASYDAVDNAGHIVSAPAFDTMVNDLQAKLANEGIDKTLHPNALAAYNRLEAAKGQPITFKGLDTLRKVAGDAIGASTMNKADQRLGYAVQNHIDDFVNNITPADILPGTGDPTTAVKNISQARDYWNRASQANLIQTQIDKAALKSKMYSQSGLENATRAQFRQLALNDKAMGRLSPDVQKAVKAVATGGPVSNVLRAVGKYAPHGPVATAAGMGAGAMLGGLTGAAEGGLASIAVPIAGEFARAGATKLTTDAAQRALDIAALGKTRIPLPSQPALQLPRLPASRALPYGLFGSGLLSRQTSQ